MLLIEIVTGIVLSASLYAVAVCVFKLRDLRRERAEGEAGFVPFPFELDFDPPPYTPAKYDAERECFTIGER